MIDANSTRPVTSAPAYLDNSSFSTAIPGLQLAIDSTSLGEFKLCPRRYQLGVVEGWQPRGTSPHLQFGLWLHSAVERYWHSRTASQDHQTALAEALAWLMAATWEPATGRGWLSDHKIKNRLSLVRTLVWYLDEKAQDDTLQPITLANGLPAVELSFTFDLGLASAVGEPFVVCGHLDRIAELSGEPYVVDIKTTSGGLTPAYFDQFSPDNQMSLYSLAGKIVYDLPIRGVIIDACQIGVTFSRFHRGLVQRTASQLDEWLADTRSWVRQLERAALDSIWPMNDKACTGPYGDCPFRPVCRKPASARQQWLQSDYARRKWDPLKARTAPAS